MTTTPTPLTFDVFVAPSVPTAGDDPPPGAKQRWWSPISATLIAGQQDAVLVDALLTTGQGERLAVWRTRLLAAAAMTAAAVWGGEAGG